MFFPEPEIRIHRGLAVVRDDLIPGGTKRRVLGAIMAAAPQEEFVFGGPRQGYAQVALAYAARDIGKWATFFLADGARHPLTAEAEAAGLRVRRVPAGRLSVVQARAREYARDREALFFPLGFDIPEFHAGLEAIARRMPQAEWGGKVFVCAGSGALSRALQRAWPKAQHKAVRIGMPPDVGAAELLIAPERFDQEARIPPPFPSCPWYDAKVWRFARRSPGALFWNVGG